MRKLRLLLALFIATMCSLQCAWADDVVANVTMKEKNSLSAEILALSGIDDVKIVTHLTVTTNPGVQLGDEDWTTLKSMVELVYLDLSNASASAVPNSQFNGYCKNLRTVKLPKDLTTIGSSAFADESKLNNVEVPNTVTAIGSSAFSSCSGLTNCDISACAINKIPSYCFYGCRNLRSFTIPSTVSAIESRAFDNCSNFTSELPEGLTSIGTAAFYKAAMTDIDVVLREGATIGQSAFSSSGIRSIVLPSTFYAYGTSEIYRGCNNLLSVTLKSPTLVTYNYKPSITGCENISLVVPSHLVAAYKSEPEWSKYKEIVPISPAITDYTVSADLTLSNSYMRLEGAPNMYFTQDASLTIAGNADQAFGDFIANAVLSDYSSSQKRTMILNETADVTVSGDFRQRFNTQSKKWHFLTLPFDFVVGDVTIQSGSFVIRTYNGAQRNSNNSASGNWSGNLGADVEIKAGTGFILQTSEATWVTFKAKVGGTNYAFGKESDELKIALAANNANTEALTAHTGWNMVGNPWQTFYNIHKMNYTAPFAVYNSSSNRYDTYSPADDDYALRPFQAMFVQCPNGVTSIDFPAAGRQLTEQVTAQNGARRVAPTGRKLFDLEVSDGSLSDKTRVVVNADASPDYEIGRDASKFFDSESATPQIYTTDGDGTQFAINERPADGGAVQLGMLFATDGEYTLSAVRNDVGQVVLTDRETGIKTNLQDHAYTFSAEAGYCDNRFTLSLGVVATGISTLKSDEADAEVYTLDGTKVGTAMSGLQKGVYVVRQAQQSKKVIIK